MPGYVYPPAPWPWWVQIVFVGAVVGIAYYSLNWKPRRNAK